MTFTKLSPRLSVEQSSKRSSLSVKLRSTDLFLEPDPDSQQNLVAQKAQERLERSWLAALVNSSPDLMGMVSVEGKWLFLNPVGQAKLGWLERTFEGEAAIAADERLWHDAIVPTVMQQGQWQGEFRLRQSSTRETVLLESQVFLVRDPDTHHPACLAIVARQPAKEPQQKKAALLATISHELRSPLTVIASSAGLLESMGKQLDVAKQQKHFQRIQAKVRQMTQLVSDLLLLARSEQTSIHLQPNWIAPQAICAELVEEAQMLSDQHELVFRVSEVNNVTQVCVDELLLQRIVTNLLSNSIKYSPNGGKIYFDLICHASGLSLEIRDEGMGILSQDQQWLFDSFYRASNAGSIPGTGLGLAIVKQCVDLHQGTIAVRSQPGVGTAFVVQLPNAVEGGGRREC